MFKDERNFFGSALIIRHLEKLDRARFGFVIFPGRKESARLHLCLQHPVKLALFFAFRIR
jgi:hypothetical protein